MPATSQSVTIINGDTLVCLPDNIVRRVIADIELGDLCKIELASWIREAKGLRDVIEIQKEQIVKKDGSIKGLYEIVKENKTQLEIKDKEIALLKTEKSTKYWKGLFTGLGTGAGIVLALVIL